LPEIVGASLRLLKNNFALQDGTIIMKGGCFVKSVRMEIRKAMSFDMTFLFSGSPKWPEFRTFIFTTEIPF
jgi:hypothetical protein